MRADGEAARGAGRGITLPWLGGFLCLLLLSSAALVWLDATRRVDRLIHDGWVRLQQSPPPDDVVIVAIDPESLVSLGRWPWPRERQTLLFEQLARHGVRAAVIDLLYVEPSARPEEDRALGEAIGRLPVSLLPVLVERGAGRAVEERLPVPALTRRVSELGHIVLPIDDDGIVRRVPLKAGFGQAHWPALALAALEAVEPGSPALERLPGRRVAHAGTPHRWVQDHEVLVPFVGPSGSFAQVSAARVLRGDIGRGELEGRIAFVGLTTTGLGDVVPTPVSALERPMPGIEMHANVFTALRDGTLVTPAPRWSGPLAALLVLPLMLLIYSRAAPRWSLPGALIGALLPVLASVLLYRYARLWYAPLSASLPILASYLLWSRHRLDFVARFLERERARLAPQQPRPDPDDDLALAGFFTHAARHLPIDGWRFETRATCLDGGARPPDGRGAATGRWSVAEGVYTKRYRALEPLRVDLAVADPELAREITVYVDSLSRIRSRERPPSRSGTVERLQASAERLREQMDWLRGVKEFSETVLAGSPIGFVVWNPAGEWVRGNALVREMVPALGERALLIDFLCALGHDPSPAKGDVAAGGDGGASGAPTGAAIERRSEDRRRFDALLLGGVPWQIAHESGERALVINFSAVGERLSRRLICASVIDVSDIRSAERARSEMVDYLSHDLRSPLVSALALLGEESEARPETSGVADNIHRSLGMMDDLLHIARADSLDEAQFVALPLDAVLDNALAGLMPQARRREVRIEADVADELPWVIGDAASLERAVANVVGNAIKYSREGGGTVRVRLRGDNGDALLEVADDGIGIDPAVIDQLFTRFRRDARVIGRVAGTGLGLAFVARVVRQHGGFVDASSRPGEGTRVSIRLPLERGGEVEAAE